MRTARLLTYPGGGESASGGELGRPRNRCFKIALAISGRAVAARVHDRHQLFVPRLGGSAHTGRYYRFVVPCKGTWIHYFGRASYQL